ncbi:2-hydroxyacyl-CoA dehydratase [Ructibacterium gallinarum]|uniref:2-hydroxyacyl-CoA dehydratase n=1 Tax=Ructibacterium gallinarum TaxID=2779355 RepID=A0A9D5M6U7_9FIRM|nr:2-hydroxyacyl-CoA dehydratase [Ructibacterium gallinarum]MBE5040592.1 2-hydroxyacyl-CoA dehydratase [Ructibacterium gallinarum]
MRLGLDVGSTTVKLVLLNEDNHVIYQRYERHMSNVFDKVSEMLTEFSRHFMGEYQMTITGSGGLSLAKQMQIPFEQEVIACSAAVEKLIPETNVVIELGGEDAKITFYDGTIEQRMNGTCAGGTGAFIDQMALLLNTDAAGLNEAAKHYTTIYPIAARCGVFAKTDIQPLINEGAAAEDLAVSIFQAVVNQTISGLACGRVIKGNVAFLGGPLSFLSELRKRFAQTLHLSEEQVIFPENAQYYVAIGAALLAEKAAPVSVPMLLSRIRNAKQSGGELTKALPALFSSKSEYLNFCNRHAAHSVPKKELSEAKGALFLGIDAGSTTTKAAVTDEAGNLLYTYYSGNEGSPVETTRRFLKEFYEKLPENTYIAYTVTTGYGEELLKAAFHADFGEIETVAHYTAAKAFLPDVDFILDIGGQDMKCIRIKDHAIHSIMLNEACSSGCGSFLETYAKSVNMTVEEFAKQAVSAKYPVDLGTRCTVFMNSKVKQAQKDGASVADIAAGLCYSVIRNALYKVIKLRDTSEAGKNIVVQGGTFLNDAVLRSIEHILDRDVIRPDIAGTMGAYGAALIGIERWNDEIRTGQRENDQPSGILNAGALKTFSMKTQHARCGRCPNNCQLTISQFGDGEKFITGNRCEKGAGGHTAQKNTDNLYQYKYEKLFHYQPLEEKEAKRGIIGIPRVLNMYENYPFWFRFFTELGFRVVLSPPSSKAIYEMGMDTISSDTACYPAKLVHGHVKWLIEHDIKTIFYPSINYEKKEDEKADNHYNCPVVAMYPEVIAGNMDDCMTERGVRLRHPFLPYDNDKRLEERLTEEFSDCGITRTEVHSALEAARKEDREFKEDIAKKADEILERIAKNGGHAVVLAGRPYHLDPEINHGIDQVIASYGFAVLTESSVAHLSHLPRPIRVLDQWMYHSRLYKAADFCGQRNDVDLVQLNSFGCGIDAVTTDEVEELLSARNKLYTVLKIDEGSNLGAVRIRIRSLKAAIEERKRKQITPRKVTEPFSRVVYTKSMRQEYTLIIPQMAPMQFDLMESAFQNAGYRAVVLPAVDKKAVETGLKYINNDACYPTIVTLGQIISALQSGKYDLQKTAVLMSQTGGGCRASNYIALLRRALKQLHMEQVPVVSLSYVGLEKNPGLKFSKKMVMGLLFAVLYGDLFMRLTNAVRPYEQTAGSVQKLYQHWNRIARENVLDRSFSTFKQNVKKIVDDFDRLPIKEGVRKPKVGVVGEILVKYHPNANNDIVGIIEKEGGEAVVPDLLDFFMYCLKNHEFNYEKLAGTKKQYLLCRTGMNIIYHYRKPVVEALQQSKRFTAPMHIDKIAEKAEEITSLGTQCGEGWILTGEMMELIDSGVENIVCLQPFACLPNHIVGKGMIKPLRKHNPMSNIVAIDYDPGASEVNQLNRIKLMMATAHKNLQKKIEKENKFYARELNQASHEKKQRRQSIASL